MPPADINPGRDWKHLHVISVLGQGSFGTVFKAVDVRLNREVALKFLQTDDAVREGRILAGLNEQNVVKVHSFEEDAGVTALCLELIKGTTLEQLWQQSGNLTAEHAALIGIQICRALAALHRKGLLHRDLKPSNVIIGPDGRLVLIDLGLGAVWLEGNAEIAGTLPFMAPEVLKGQAASPRSDLYSLGALLFFLVTGRYCVEGSTFDEIRAHHQRRHLADEGSFPSTFAKAVETALAYDPAVRFRSAGEFMAALESLLVQRPRLPLARRKILIIGVFLIVLLGGLAFLSRSVWLTSSSYTALETNQLVRGPGLAHSPSMSANGQVLVYAWDGGNSGHMDIYAKYPDQAGALPITQDDADHAQPSVSPDGTKVVYRSERDGGGLYISSTLGVGGERKLAIGGHDPQFSPDGTQVAYWTGLGGNTRFATGRFFIIPTAGGTPVEIVPGFGDARLPIWSPDGKWILFLGSRDLERSPDQAADWYLVQLDQPGNVVQLNLNEQLRAQGLKLYSCPLTWANHELYFAAYHGESSNLWAVQIHIGRQPSIGSLRQITSGPAIEAEPYALANGTIAFSDLHSNVNIWVSRLGAPQTPIEKLTSSSFTITSQPSISKDGKILAFIRREGTATSVYLRMMETTQEIKIATKDVLRPVVSPDGSRIAYSQNEGTSEAIWMYDRETATTKKICADCGMVLDWTADMRGIAYSRGPRPRISLLDIKTEQSVALLSSSSSVLYDQLHFSPDGTHVAFIRQLENSKREIVIAPFRQGLLGDVNTWTTLNSGSRWDSEPRWTRDGRALVFLSRRDSHACIWQISLDASAKPSDFTLKVVQHLHQGSLSTQELSDISFQLAVGGKLVLYNLAELSSTIWAAHPKN